MLSKYFFRGIVVDLPFSSSALICHFLKGSPLRCMEKYLYVLSLLHRSHKVIVILKYDTKITNKTQIN